ncbi:MAG: S41 family peptidase [Elusimicrobiota bacterium]|jgi:carboxyl-terminal processing protease
MKRTILAAISLSILLPYGAHAQLTYSDFRTIRGAALSDEGAAHSMGKIVPVDYTMVPGPAANPPAEPPNLKLDSVNAVLMKRLWALQQKGVKKELFTQEHINRLMRGLGDMDMQFVDPISPARWETILEDMAATADKEYAKGVLDGDKLVDGMLKQAVDDLKEPHSEYLDPDEVAVWQQHIAGTSVGIGVLCSTHAKGVLIEAVFPGSGAQKAGLQSEDVITAVVVDKKSMKLAGRPLKGSIKLIAGEAGTKVLLKILRNGAVLPEPIEIERSSVEVPNNFSKMAAPGIGYVYFREFSKNTDQQVLDRIRSLRSQGAKSLILDVRGNPGGLVPSVASIASEFLKDNEDIVSFKHQSMIAVKAVTKGDGEFLDMPLVVLVNGNSASASEILSATMQDRRDGYTIIGSRSYGKGTQQALIPQGDGRSLKLTQNRWYSSADRTIDAQHDPDTGKEIAGTGGVVPDLSVELSEEQEAKIMGQIMEQLFKMPAKKEAVQDPVLEKAIEVLSHAKAG